MICHPPEEHRDDVSGSEGSLSDPSYLTTSDGRPTVILFSTGFDTVQDDMFAVSTLYDQVRAALNKNPFIIWLYNPEHTAFVVTDYGVDGFICFHYGPAKPAEPYTEMLAHWQSIMNKLSGFFHVPCASTCFDARPWYRITWGFDNQYINSFIYNTDITLSAFSDHAKEAKTYLDAYSDTTSRMLVIYAWNEWAEAGVIEPSRVGGYEYLDSIQSIFGLVSQTEQPSIPSSVPESTQTSPSISSTSPSSISTPVKSDGDVNPVCNIPSLGLMMVLLLLQKRRG